MERGRILVVKSVSDDLFRRLYGRARATYRGLPVSILCREDEKSKLQVSFPKERFLTYGGEKFNALAAYRALKTKMRSENISKTVILFRDRYGERYFHYRLFPVLAGHKRFSTINALEEVEEYDLGGWLKFMLVSEGRARVLSLFYLYDLLRFFSRGVVYIFMDRLGMRKREKSDPVSGPVLFFISSLGMGGAQRQLFYLARELVRRGIDVHVACIWKDDAFFEESFHEQGISVTYLVDEYEYWFNSVILKRLRALMAERRYSILHNWMILSNILGTMAARGAGVPVIVNSVRTIEINKYPWYRWWYRLADALAFRLADSTIVNSHAVYSDYSRWVWSEKGDGRIQTVYNGFDLQDFNHQQTGAGRILMGKEDGRTIGYFGRLSEEKDVFTFLKILSRLFPLYEDLRGKICGDGYQMDEAKAFIRMEGIEKRVSLAGHVSNVYEEMSGCHLIVSTSRVEGLPNSLIEAQLLGIPVVATDAGGTAETLENGNSGFLFPVGDVDEGVRKVRLLLDDDNLREKFRERGRERSRKLFSVDRMVAATLSTYGA